MKALYHVVILLALVEGAVAQTYTTSDSLLNTGGAASNTYTCTAGSCSGNNFPIVTGSGKQLWQFGPDTFAIGGAGASGTITQTYSGTGSFTINVNLSGYADPSGVAAYPFIRYGADQYGLGDTNLAGQPPKFPQLLTAMSSLVIDMNYSFNATPTPADLLFDNWVCRDKSITGSSSESDCLEIMFAPYYNGFTPPSNFKRTISVPATVNGSATTLQFDEYLGDGSGGLSNLVIKPHTGTGAISQAARFDMLPLLVQATADWGDATFRWFMGVEIGSEFGTAPKVYTLTFTKLQIELTPTSAFSFGELSDNQGEGTGGLNGATVNGLKNLSAKLYARNPAFVLFAGDVMQDTDVTSGTFKAAMNGGTTPGNGLATKTFSVRGNHDQASTTWRTYFPMATVAAVAGSTNFSTQNSTTRCGTTEFCLGYSFDYGNSHFVALDQSGIGVSTTPADLVTWLGTDLTAAEGRGLKHAFVMFHAATYWTEVSHTSQPSAALIAVLNAHPIIAAIYNGHEHMQQYVLLNSSHSFTNGTVNGPIYQLMSAHTDTDWYDCGTGRILGTDWAAGMGPNCPGMNNVNGYSTTSVNDNAIAVNWYKSDDTLLKTLAFTHGAASPTSYTISGTVSTGAGSANPNPGVTVSCPACTPTSTTTDGAGAYTFGTESAGGNYILTPSKTGYTFSPASATFNNLAANQTANFTAYQAPIPSCSPAGGTFKSGRMIACSNAVPSATICWRIGSAPTTNGNGTCTAGTTYVAPFMISSTATLYVVGTQSGNTDSSVNYPFTISPSWTAGWVMNSSVVGSTKFGGNPYGPPLFRGSTQSTAMAPTVTLPSLPSINSTGYSYSGPGDFYYPSSGVGNCITRLTDSSSRGGQGISSSWSRGASNFMWDVNRTYGAGVDFNGNVVYMHVHYDNGCMKNDTLSPLPTSLSGGTGNGGFTFARKTPNIAYKVDGAPHSTSGTNLYEETLSGTTTITVTRRFLFNFNDCPGLDHTLLTQGGNGNLGVSDDDNVFVTTLNFPPAINGQDGAHWVVSWNRQNSTCTTYYTGIVGNAEQPDTRGNVWAPCSGNCSRQGSNPAPLALNTTCDSTATGGYGMHGNQIVHNGLFVDISGKCNGVSGSMTFWQIGTNNIDTCNSDRYACGGHNADGYSTLRAFCNAGGCNGGSASYNIRPVNNLSNYTQIKAGSPVNADYHGSQNWAGPAADVNPQMMTSLAPVSRVCTSPYCAEVVAVRLDGTIARFSPTFHLSGGNLDVGAIAVMTQDGYCVVMDSNWNETLGTYSTYNRSDLFAICNLQ